MGRKAIPFKICPRCHARYQRARIGWKKYCSHCLLKRLQESWLLMLTKKGKEWRDWNKRRLAGMKAYLDRVKKEG